MIKLIYNSEFLTIGDGNTFEVLDIDMVIFNTDNIRIYYRNSKVLSRNYTEFIDGSDNSYPTSQAILDELTLYKANVISLIQPDYTETDSSKKTFIKNKLPFGEAEFNLKADISYVDGLALGLNWRDPVELVNVIGNSNTPITGNDLDGYIIDVGGNTGIWSAFQVGDLIQKQDSTWVKIKSLQIGDRLGVDFKNTSTPIGLFTGKNNNLVEVTGTSSGNFTYTFTPPSNNLAVFVQNSNAFLYNVSFVYSSSLSRWVQLSASTNRVFDSNFILAGNTVSLNPSVIKSTLNLNNLDNTSDALKPISNATQTALNLKANSNHIHEASDITDFNNAVKSAETTTFINKAGGTITYTDEDSNTYSFTKTDLNLGNVPNLDTTTAVANQHTHSNKPQLDLVSGTNTGDETTSSIQTKRPLKTINNISLEGTGNINVPTASIIELPSSYASTNTTRANIPEFIFNMVAGKIYEVYIYLSYQTAATTTGVSVGVITPTGSANVTGNLRLSVASTASAGVLDVPITAVSSSNSLAGSFGTSTGVSAINTPHTGELLVLVKCTTSGTFQVQFGSEVLLSNAILNQISTMLITQLN